MNPKPSYPIRSFHKARTAKWCQSSALFIGCKRDILPGETYAKTFRCGLESYILCNKCANKAISQKDKP